MNKLRVVFFFALLGIVVAIARCNSNPKSQAESPTFSTPASQIASNTTAPTPAEIAAATATPQPSQGPVADFRKASERVNPAVILVSVFDNSGKLLRTGTGFFVADDGRFVTSKYVVEGAANAVAKMSDGRIYNVSGILAEGNALDLAVLKAEPKKPVPFVAPVKTGPPAIGAPIAVIGSSLGHRKTALSEGKISARKSDQNGEWLELSATISGESIGSPVVNENGDVIGVVTSQSAPAGAANIVRLSTDVDSLLAHVASGASAAWQVQAPSPPAIGPTPPRTPKALVGRAGPGSRLTYSPIPQYPTAARHSYFPLKGSGRYRVTFTAKGDVKNVEIVQSTHSDLLDTAAADALRKWKAAPGQEWTATVPITFQP
jgi:TonB family protein